MRFWEALFIPGYGFWSALENALIGPVLAFISFVCSLGNIPLAAALWHGGISFGGVIAFIFADLLAFPIVMIYRKIYGGALALRLALVFWLVMSLSGLITEGIFHLLNLIPTEHKMAPMGMRTSTLILNILALILLGVIIWLYRARNRGEVATEFATDFVCGMQVRIADAPAKVEVKGTMYYFCMDGCRERFLATPEKFRTH
jgi:YHS domain-containing protein